MGKAIMDEKTCKQACKALNVPQIQILGNNLCYKDHQGNCYQNGRNGAGASLICIKSVKSQVGSTGLDASFFGCHGRKITLKTQYSDAKYLRALPDGYRVNANGTSEDSGIQFEVEDLGALPKGARKIALKTIYGKYLAAKKPAMGPLESYPVSNVSAPTTWRRKGTVFEVKHNANNLYWFKTEWKVNNQSRYLLPYTNGYIRGDGKHSDLRRWAKFTPECVEGVGRKLGMFETCDPSNQVNCQHGDECEFVVFQLNGKTTKEYRCVPQLRGANGGASGKVMYCNPDQGEFDNTRCQDGQRCVWEDIGFGLDFGVCENVENHIAENTALGRQGSWRENCNPGGLCGRGNRGTDMWWAICDTSNSKKNDPDYCGQCKYGFRTVMGAMGAFDSCCTLDEVLKNKKGYCLCQAEYAPNCPAALSTSGVVGSGAPTGENHLWSPNVETVLKYKSNDLTSMLQNNQQFDQLNIPSPITMEADVKVQAFRDETLRVKFEHTKFYSQNEEVSVSNAHRILDIISTKNGHGRHAAHIFKTSLEQPMMIQVKNGQAKDVLVSKNELDCVSKIKLMLVKNLMQNEENQQLKVVKKESITKPFELPPQSKKIDLSME